MTTPAIRHATPDDLDQLAPLFDAYRRFYEQPGDVALASAYLLDRLERRESTILVAEGDGQMLGFCQLYPTWCSVAAARIFVLYDLFVDDGVRRAGVGRALMQAAQDFGRAAGAARLDLSTAHTNTRAQALYESLGWQRDEVYFTYSLELVMVAPDRVRAPSARIVVSGLVVVAFGVLVAHDILLGRRVAVLEAAVAERDTADPLMPFECLYPRDRAPLGRSRDSPCIVTFQRLLDAPQQFHGRWVEVQGRLSSGFERSALYPVDSTSPADGSWDSDAHALAVGVAPFAPLDAQGRGAFVGRFNRGPAGHLAAYFASLNDQ